MKKALKIAAIIFGLLIAALLVLIFLIFYNLPNAKDVGSFFKKENTKKAVATEAEKENVTKAIVSSGDVTSTEHNLSNEPRIITEKELQDEKQEFLDFIDERKPLINFCNFLDQAKTGKVDMNALMKSSKTKHADGSTSEIKGNVDKNTFDDLRFKAIEPFFKTILTQPEMKKFLFMIFDDEALLRDLDQDIESLKQTGFSNKLNFYKQAYSAYSELKTNLPVYESIVDRSYLMYKLNDLVAYKPDLQNDQRLKKYCEDNEYLFNSKAPLNFEGEKASFERLVQELGVDPKDIKYDPNYKTKLDLNFTGNNLQIGGGWLNEIIEPPKSSTATAPQGETQTRP